MRKKKKESNPRVWLIHSESNVFLNEICVWFSLVGGLYSSSKSTAHVRMREKRERKKEKRHHSAYNQRHISHKFAHKRRNKNVIVTRKLDDGTYEKKERHQSEPHTYNVKAKSSPLKIKKQIVREFIYFIWALWFDRRPKDGSEPIATK